ncbi:TonB-dependent receptor [Flammeovirga sp. EKP202]|uniref:TonB-dependent receptor n=1 Tax=Flammeovirga sp. EKP202 TaxID=2770592 RepID=UPI00165FE562|nr:TonB-dependent receptor [Flammeovirga sp. EKP202]MBD0403660.1 TonB-dependent receptor [Flammeovirga sp. EKP202]
MINKITICVLMFFCTLNALAQVPEVTLEVVDTAEGLPLVGAHVCLISASGEKHYYSTDEKGKAVIAFNEKMQCTVSYTGFKTKELVLEEGKTIKVKLKTDLLMLDQVVKTASVEPERVDQSIYRIGIITADNMEKQGVQNIRDALRFQPNINLVEDGVLGSQIIMQGLKGQHVKFLIDGMPIVGRQDGNIDLSQIDMSQVDHIEIIEGPMSVVYGSNALAGTINIITKENKYYSMSVDAGAYAESIGQLNGNVSAQGNKGNSKFGISGGYRYFNGHDKDPSDRSMNWNPKKQINADAYYGVKLSGWDTKFGIRLSNDDLTLKGDYLAPYRAIDQNFITQRMTYYGQFDKTFRDNSSLVGQISYNTYKRTGQEYVVKEDLNEEDKKGDPTVDRFETLNARLSYGKALNAWLKWQLGYELNHETGEGDKIESGTALIENSLWSDLKINLTEQLVLQPGVRYINHNTYAAPLIYSTHLKWNTENNWSSRISVAKGFRAPSMKELYMEFVDFNHRIFGNENLKPETSYSLTATVSKAIDVTETSALKYEISGFYNHLNDVIELAMGEDGVSYFYQNVSQKRTHGGTFSVNYNNNNRLKMNAGVTLTGIGYDFFDSGDFDFTYSTDFVAMAAYFWPKLDLSMQLDYKYTGRRVQLLMVDVEESQLEEGTVDSYNMLNYSVTKNFKNKRFALNAGVKNILDVTDVTNTTQGGAHSGGSNMLIAWGRTYFISLKYHLNKI